MDEMVKVSAVTTLDGFRVRLTFANGVEKEVDLERYLHGPIFEPLRTDPQVFRAVRVDGGAGTIVWENGADIDPYVLYYDLTPAWMEAEEEVA
jgi:Protein of unknown function (DUF2442)